jgi:hypothetical protein
MAVAIRRPPSQAEAQDFRAREYYDQAIHDQLSLVGTATVDLGSIGAGGVATFTITVTGARADQQQQVALGPPSAIEAGLVWCGVVSADDTVTVRVHNTTGSPIDPASATWGARVLR